MPPFPEIVLQAAHLRKDAVDLVGQVVRLRREHSAALRR
jgi:hypothetical protein